jgi:hypothetical protein
MQLLQGAPAAIHLALMNPPRAAKYGCDITVLVQKVLETQAASPRAQVRATVHLTWEVGAPRRVRLMTPLHMIVLAKHQSARETVHLLNARREYMLTVVHQLVKTIKGALDSVEVEVL